jgi:hypothetical protein
VSGNPDTLNSFPEESYFLCRIIGNDLLPRHSLGQTSGNVKFILDNEEKFENCTKYWLINRIWDADERRRIVDLLVARGQSFQEIPFEYCQYATLENDPVENAHRDLDGAIQTTVPDNRTHIVEMAARRSKNIYAINNNGARNLAIEIGRQRARWILPWDGNAFLTPQGWRQLCEGLRRGRHYRYVTVPMARITDNSELLDYGFAPAAAEEPQIVFRADAPLRYDERMAYGRRPKVELLWRLGVAGPWDKFKTDPTDLPRPGRAVSAGACGSAGWVARLSSGNPTLETGERSARLRNAARAEAIVAALDRLDVLSLASRLDPGKLTYYGEAKLRGLASDPGSALAVRLRRDAEAALLNPLRSVTDKAAGAPGGTLNDYWSVAPFWWPDPDSEDGMPFVRKDGERVPGTKLFEPGSERYDRTRLFAMIRDVTTLALASRVFGQKRYSERAAEHLRSWFLDPARRMAPGLEFAQVRGGRLDGRGSVAGIVEAKDFYFLMDALRLLEGEDALSGSDRSGLRDWFQAYFDWLTRSGRGTRAALRANNLGTMYDLQCGAIAAYLGNAEELNRVLQRARLRIDLQFGPAGEQPDEMGRAAPWHYCIFNLAGWTALARLAQSVDDRLWNFRSPQGRGIGLALDWLLANAPKTDGDQFASRDLAPHEIDAGSRFPDPRYRFCTNSTGTSLEGISLEAGFGPYAELTRKLGAAMPGAL